MPKKNPPLLISDFEQLLGVSNSLIYQMDRATMALSFISGPVQRILGREVEECLGDRDFWQQVVHPEDLALVLAQRERSLSTGTPHMSQYRLVRRGGEIRRVTDYVSVPNEAVLRGIMVDFTDRVKSEQVVSLSSALLAGAEDAVFALDLQGIITYWNGGAERLYGLTAAQVIGQPATILTGDGDRRTRGLANRARLARGESVAPYEGRFINALGQEVWGHVTLSPVRTQDGTFAGSSAIVRDISPLKWAQAAQQRAEALLSSSGDAAVAIDLKGVVTYWNRGAERLLETPAAQAVGEPFLQFFPSGASERARALFGAIREGQDVPPFPWDITLKDGRLRQTIITASPIYGPAGDLVGVSALLKDVTELKQAEETAELAAALLASADDAVVGLDLQGSITFWNPGAERLYSLPASAALGHSMHEFLRTEAAHKSTDASLAAARTGKALPPFEARLPVPDGAQRNLYVTTSLMYDRARHVTGVSSIIRDITALKRAEAASQRAEALLQSSNEGIIAFDLDGIVTDWNRGAEQLYDAPAADTIGKSIYDLDPEHAAESRAGVQAAKEGEATLPAMRTHRKADGSILHILNTSSPIRNPAGELIGFSVIASDITPQKQVEEALRALSAQLMELLEAERLALSHELHDAVGQTLTGLKLSLEFMARDKEQVNPQRLRDAVAQAQAILEQVRNVSVDLRPPLLERNGLAPALDSLVERFEERTRIRVEVNSRLRVRRLEPSVGLAAYRIVQEALTNVARHAQVREASVLVTTQAGHLCVEIRDQGQGFVTNGVLGTAAAVGLSGMTERARALGGTLMVESQPGEGTRVLALLPLKPAVKRSLAQSRGAAPRARSRGE